MHQRIHHRVYKLLKEARLPYGVVFPANQELEIVEDVVYIQGAMLPPTMQTMLYNWITQNPALFKDDTRRF